MTQNARSEANSKAVVPVVLFGVDDHGKPKAARFPDKHADLASKAAEQLQLRVLAITNSTMTELAAKLPAGRIHANGKGFVPYIRRDLYAKLVAAADQAGPAPTSAASPSGGTGGTGDGSPPASGTARLPRDWEEIGLNHVVIAHEDTDEGWYEAVVVERNGDMLSLRWRDYPRQRGVTRHRLSVGLMCANVQASAMTTAGVTASTAPQSPKARTGKDPTPPSTKIDRPFPTKWEEIDVDHLVLAKQDGPWGNWWEAVPIENHGDQLTLRWRDFPKLPTIVRPRFSLGLLYPKPS